MNSKQDERLEYIPLSPEIFGCRRDFPVLTTGRSSSLTTRRFAADEIKRHDEEYEKAVQTAKEVLRPVIEKQQGLGDFEIPIDMPGLKGVLISTLNHRKLYSLQLSGADKTQEEIDDVVYRVWYFVNQGKAQEIGLTPLATRIQRGYVTDLDHTLKELGLPDRAVYEINLGRIALTWDKSDFPRRRDPDGLVLFICRPGNRRLSSAARQVSSSKTMEDALKHRRLSKLIDKSNTLIVEEEQAKAEEELRERREEKRIQDLKRQAENLRLARLNASAKKRNR